MERSRSAVTEHGLGLCSVSYDSVEILRDFAARRGITFPLLSDLDSVIVEIEPAPGVHVYGPTVGSGYQGLEVTIDPQPFLTVYPPNYPEAATLSLPWAGETLTGYTGPARTAIDVSLGTRQDLTPVLETGQGLTITGSVKVQACDDRLCWPPESIPVNWRFNLLPPDLERPPEALQHRAKA